MFATVKNVLRSAVFIAVLLLCCLTISGNAHAGYSAIVHGIKVTYSKPGCEAYYDYADNTLTVNVTEADGNLSVVATKDAPVYYSGGIDVFLNSPWRVNAVTVKGYWNPSTQVYRPMFLVGQIYRLKSFAFTYGWSGLTASYPSTGVGSDQVASRVTMSYAGAAYNLLGLDYNSYKIYSTVAESKVALKEKSLTADFAQALSERQTLIDAMRTYLINKGTAGNDDNDD